METGLHFLMQKTKSKISKTFVYQFESNFHIESSADNITLDFSDNKYISKSNDFIGDLKIAEQYALRAKEVVERNKGSTEIQASYIINQLGEKNCSL